MSPIRVVIADDHKLERTALCDTLEEETDIEIVGVAADGAQALELAIELRPHVVVADISMPPPDGIEIARRLCRDLPAAKTLIISMYEDASTVHDALGAGASGYLVKRAATPTLAQAIRTVAAGERYLDEELRQYSGLDAPVPTTI